MKIFNGKLGEKFWDQESPEMKKLFEWGANLKRGDLYQGCDYLNHVVHEIKIKYAIIKSHSEEDGWDWEFEEEPIGENWCVLEIDLIQENGYQHTVGSGGCAVPPWTREEIEKALLEVYDVEKYGEFAAKKDEHYEVLIAGNHIVDENGIILPEYSKKTSDHML